MGICKKNFNRQSNKRDRTLIKLYKVMNLLNCFGNIVEKLVAEKISQFWEAQGKLHKSRLEEQNTDWLMTWQHL